MMTGPPTQAALLVSACIALCKSQPEKSEACPFRKFHPVGIRAVRQNHRIIRVDAFEGAKLSHGETVSGKETGRPPQEGRHPRCRPRARAHRPSIRPSPPGTVQGLLRRALHTVRYAPAIRFSRLVQDEMMSLRGP